MSSVYVFNATPEQVRLSVGNQWLSYPISPAPAPPASAPYTPFGVQIARSDAPPTGIAFVNGAANPVVVQVRQVGQTQPAQVHVPAAAASTVDLWLYLFSSVVVLFDTTGAVEDEQPLLWSS